MEGGNVCVRESFVFTHHCKSLDSDWCSQSSAPLTETGRLHVPSWSLHYSVVFPEI